eukprot:Hpha_TRINITY_DN16820_c6_g7::TRINITY_DN16820_c6_g7_i1::g.151499::m.151499
MSEPEPKRSRKEKKKDKKDKKAKKAQREDEEIDCDADADDADEPVDDFNILEHIRDMTPAHAMEFVRKMPHKKLLGILIRDPVDVIEALFDVVAEFYTWVAAEGDPEIKMCSSVDKQIRMSLFPFCSMGVRWQWKNYDQGGRAAGEVEELGPMCCVFITPTEGTPDVGKLFMSWCAMDDRTMTHLSNVFMLHIVRKKEADSETERLVFKVLFPPNLTIGQRRYDLIAVSCLTR